MLKYLKSNYPIWLGILYFVYKIPNSSKITERTELIALGHPDENDPYRLKASLIVKSSRYCLTVVSKAGKV